MEKSILETVLHYKYMEDNFPHSGMLREVKYQYADMASGGDGGELGFEKKWKNHLQRHKLPKLSRFFLPRGLRLTWLALVNKK